MVPPSHLFAGVFGWCALLPFGSQACDPVVSSDWREIARQHVEGARARTLAACAEKGLALPAEFVAWIDGDPVLRTSVYGCRKDPLPVLLALRSLDIDLGEEVVRREYPQLALAFAIQGSYRPLPIVASDWNDVADPVAAPLPDISPRPRLELEIPGDPRRPVDTHAAGRDLDQDDHVINFLEDHEPIEVEVLVWKLPPLEYDEHGQARPRGDKKQQVTETVRRQPLAADVIASAALQQEFNAYMAEHGHAEVQIDCGDRSVHWYARDAVGDEGLRVRIRAAHELFAAAYRAKGRLPVARDRAPSAAESMAWFVRNDRLAVHAAEEKARRGPRFPLSAPWPVLMMLAADDQPLREREDIWSKLREQGEMRTYGEYIGGIAQQFDMQSARRLSPFAFGYGSIQMMWKDGGVCGTMGNIGARTYRICGVPASTAGQPGHCALVKMEWDATSGAFACKGGQYATGGDEVTAVHAGWNFDDRGGRRPMVYHQTVAWGVNRGLETFVEVLAMCRAFEAMDAAARAQEAVSFAEQGLRANPFAIAVTEAATASLSDAEALAGLRVAVDRVLDEVLGSEMPQAETYALYRRTVRERIEARM